MISDVERNRIIAYHDQVACKSPSGCVEDLMTYPKPPADWIPGDDHEEPEGVPHTGREDR